MHLTIALVLLASAAQHVVLAASNPACSSGIYKALLPLSAYAPAESYCSAHYPLPTVTVVATPPVTPKIKRNAYKTTTTTKKTTTPKKTTTSTTTKPITTTTSNAHQAQWSSLLSAAGSVLQTLCSCIETAPTTVVTFTFRRAQQRPNELSRSLPQPQQLRLQLQPPRPQQQRVICKIHLSSTRSPHILQYIGTNSKKKQHPYLLSIIHKQLTSFLPSTRAAVCTTPGQTCGNNNPPVCLCQISTESVYYCFFNDGLCPSSFDECTTDSGCPAGQVCRDGPENGCPYNSCIDANSCADNS